jgi:hypothetical protein
VLAIAAGVVLFLAWRAARPKPTPSIPDAAETVREVAGRHGCPPGRVIAEFSRDRRGTLVSVTVHAPRGFPADRFTLDLEATAHNLGGRLEPAADGEGRVRPEAGGRSRGTRWRVLVLGEPPPRAPSRAAGQLERPARLAIVLTTRR